MRAWAQGKWPKYQLPSETRRFSKLALAIAMHEIDEAVVDRQLPLWLDDLQLMLDAQNAPNQVGEIALPEGFRPEPGD